MPLPNPNDPGYGAYSTEAGLVSTATPEAYATATYIGRSTPRYHGRELSQQEQASRARASSEANLRRRYETISKKEMQIDYKYSKYMTDEGFVVYHRGTDKVDKQQTQRLYQQYYKEQMVLNKQIESYQSAHGRYASKYDLKSYDPQEMQKREYAEALIGGRYAVTPRTRKEKMADAFVSGVQKLERQSLGSEAYKSAYPQAVQAQGETMAFWTTTAPAMMSSFYSTIGKTTIGISKGSRYVWQHKKEIPSVAWQGTVLAGKGIKFAIEKPAQAYTITRAFGGKLYAGEKKSFFKDPVAYGTSWWTFGKISKGIKGTYRGVKGSYKSRVYTEWRTERIYTDSMMKAMMKSQTKDYIKTIGKSKTSFDISKKYQVIKLRKGGTKKRYDLQDPMGTFISLERKSYIQKPITVSWELKEMGMKGRKLDIRTVPPKITNIRWSRISSELSRKTGQIGGTIKTYSRATPKSPTKITTQQFTGQATKGADDIIKIATESQKLGKGGTIKETAISRIELKKIKKGKDRFDLSDPDAGLDIYKATGATMPTKHMPWYGGAIERSTTSKGAVTSWKDKIGVVRDKPKMKRSKRKTIEIETKYLDKPAPELMFVTKRGRPEYKFEGDLTYAKWGKGRTKIPLEYYTPEGRFRQPEPKIEIIKDTKGKGYDYSKDTRPTLTKQQMKNMGWGTGEAELITESLGKTPQISKRAKSIMPSPKIETKIKMDTTPTALRPTPGMTKYEEYGVLGEGGFSPKQKGTLDLKAGTIGRLAKKYESKLESKQKQRSRQDLGIATMISPAIKTSQQYKFKQMQKQRTRIKTKTKLQTKQIQKMSFGMGFGFKGMGTIKTIAPKKPKKKKIPGLGTELKPQSKAVKDILGRGKHKRKPRYAPSLTGLALRIKQPKGTKRGKFSGLEIRGI